MAQSERLIRNVKRDITFDGYFIPKHSKVRLCFWESHNSEESFPEAFLFDPDRFLENSYTSDEYAPFGLDHHRCPFAGIVFKLSTMFLENLDFSVRLHRR